MVKYTDLTAIVLVFVVAAIVLGLGAEVTERAAQGFHTIHKDNESHTFTNNTCESIDERPYSSISRVANYSYIMETGVNAGGTYWETCPGDESLKIVVNDSYNTLTWNVSYSHRATTSYRTAHNTTKGLGELASWAPTIALVLAAALVLGTVMKSFLKGGV